MIGYRLVLFLLLPAILLVAAGLVVTKDFFSAWDSIGEESTETDVKALHDQKVYVEAEIFSDTSEPDTLYLALAQATLQAANRHEEADFFCLHGAYVRPSFEQADNIFLPDAPFDGHSGENELPVFWA